MSDVIFKRFLREPQLVKIDGLTEPALWSIEVYQKSNRKATILIVHCFQKNGSVSSNDFENIKTFVNKSILCPEKIAFNEVEVHDNPFTGATTLHYVYSDNESLFGGSYPLKLTDLVSL